MRYAGLILLIFFFVGCPTLGILFVKIVMFICDITERYKIKNDDQCIELDYKHWEEIYFVNPDRWDIWERGPIYDTWLGSSKKIICFSPLDFIRYKSFYRAYYKGIKKKDKERKNDFMKKQTIAFIEEVEKDIQKQKEEAERRIQEARNLASKVSK